MFAGQARLTAVLRAQANKAMSDTCTLVDRTGAQTTGVRCRVEKEKYGSAAPDAELNMAINSYTLHVPYNTTIKKDYRVEHSGHTYEITYIADDITPLIEIEASMERVT